MKTLSFIAALFMGTALFAQDIPESQVPSVVLNTFKQQFPKASDVEWEKKGDHYNVDFEIGFFTDYEAWFDATGNMLKYETEISESDLPKAVKQAISSQYPDFRIDDADKIVQDGNETFLVEIEKGNVEKHLTFSANGSVVSTQLEK